MRERYKLDILAEILDIASSGARKTTLMYNANLSFMKLQECLHSLMGAGLLEHAKAEHIYITTVKGLRFLHAYNEMANLLQDTSTEKVVTTAKIVKSSANIS